MIISTYRAEMRPQYFLRARGGKKKGRFVQTKDERRRGKRPNEEKGEGASRCAQSIQGKRCGARCEQLKGGGWKNRPLSAMALARGGGGKEANKEKRRKTVLSPPFNPGKSLGFWKER